MEHLLLMEIEKKYQHSEYENKNIEALLRAEIDESNFKIIVLDDDPTGVQTVHDISVYTDWNYESILQGFLEEQKLFYVLTNSRALTEEQTSKVHMEIGKNILKVSEMTGKDFLIICRGDSTLRGHYPLETQILKEVLENGTGRKIDGEILIPYFKAGGRYTIDNIHYVKYGDELIPVADTEFAGDKTFGYKKSDLCEYIEEKTGGTYPAEEVTVISLKEVRKAELNRIEEALTLVTDFRKVIVNAIEPRDLETFCVALYRAVGKGKRYLFRTAADFVKAVGGISNQELLKNEDMITIDNNNGGIIVIGSHTAKTTAQLEDLKKLEQLEFIEFNSDLVLEDKLQEEVNRIVQLSSSCIAKGKTVVTYTNRKLLILENDTKEKALLRSVMISEAVQQLVKELTTVPKFVIAKGGITSSDIGVKALSVRKAYVLGQVLPGIPVWKTDENSRFPGIPYIIFPGNVGGDDDLRQVVIELMR